MPGPWDKYAQQPRGPWTQYQSAPEETTTPPPALDTRNGLQKAFDESTAPLSTEQRKGAPDWLNEASDVPTGFISGMGSLVVHPMQSVEGLVHAFSHPRDTVETASRAFEEHPGYTIGQTLGAGTAAVGAGGAADNAIARIPTKAKAGELFSTVAKDAADQPVSLTRTQPHIQKMLTLGKEGNGTVPLPVRQLANAGGESLPRSVPILRRMENELNGVSEAPEPKPLLYPSARNFQSGLSRLSREDVGNMGGNMKGTLKQLNKALYDDIHEATSTVGRGEDYAKAMRDMKWAGRAGELVNNLKKWALPAAAGAAGVGGVTRLMHALEGK